MKIVRFFKGIIRLYSWTGQCRKIAETFNRLHTSQSVSKSYVYSVMVYHLPEIIELRKRLKHNIPKAVPKNHVWSMDLTLIDRQQVFGVIDNGTRGLIYLENLKDKSSLSLLKALIGAIEKFGKPKVLKSDNEIVFTSKLMKFALWFLGIEQQTSDIASPWQNGRIERLFGTLKESIKDLVFPDTNALRIALTEFRFFYNHVRPHQHLYGKTPFEAWSGRDKVTSKTAKEVLYFEGLCGNIGGFYFME